MIFTHKITIAKILYYDLWVVDNKMMLVMNPNDN